MRLLQNLTRFAIFLFALLPVTSQAEGEKIFVTLPPQAWLVEKIAGPAVEVCTLVDKGQDPHTFEPSPRQATALAQARLYFTVGLPFEKRLVGKALANNRKLKISDATLGIERLAMEEPHDEDHHPPGKIQTDRHQHQAGEPDPHVWLAPANLRRMAANMTPALIALLPGKRELFTKNLAVLDGELAALDRKLAARLAPWQGRTFYVFHPAFAYFAKAYGLKQEAVETGGKSPHPKQIAALIRQAREDQIKTIFVQPQFDPRAAQNVAKGIGGRVVSIDPMAREVTENLSAMAAALAESFQATTTVGK